MFIKRFRQLISILVSLALLWTGGNVAEAAINWRPSQASPRVTFVSFRRNQERMRLETQALSTQPTSALENILSNPTRPYLARLLNPSRILVPEETEAFSEVPDGSAGTMSSSPPTATPSRRPLLWFPVWPIQLGLYGFRLANEWMHMAAAVLVSPWKSAALNRDAGILIRYWKTIFTAENLRGGQSWTEYWFKGIFVLGRQEGDPEVRIPVQETWRDNAIRWGGFALTLVPFLALTAALKPFLSGAGLTPAIPLLLLGGAAWALIEAFANDVFLGENEAGVYNCGNVVLLAHASVALGAAIDALENMLDAASNRGHNSGGVVTYLEKKTRGNGIAARLSDRVERAAATFTVRARVNNWKRGNLRLLLMTVFFTKLFLTVGFLWVTLHRVSFGAIKLFHGHVRYPTWAPAKAREAHPFRGGKGRWVRKWMIEDVPDPATGVLGSKLVLRLRWFEDYLTHNGDFHTWVWRGKKIASKKIAQWMDRALYSRSEKPWAKTLYKAALYAVRKFPLRHTAQTEEEQTGDGGPNPVHFPGLLKPFYFFIARAAFAFYEAVKWLLGILDGDSPRLAKLVHFHHTQGMWDASLALAYQYEIAQSSEENGIPNEEVPPETLFEKTGELCNTIAQKYAADLIGKEAKHLTEADPGKIAALTEELAQALEQNPEWSSRIAGTPAQKAAKIRDWAMKTVHVFLENDLLTAQQYVMQRFGGTGGVVSSSTLEKDRVIATAYKQEIYLGMSDPEEIGKDPEGRPVQGSKWAGISSDATAVKSAGPFDNQWNVDQETVELVMNQDGSQVTFYPLRMEAVASSAILEPLTAEAVRKRRERLKGNRFMSPVQPSQGSKAIQNSLDSSAAALRRMRESFNPAGDKFEPNAETMKNFAPNVLAIELAKAIESRMSVKIDHYAVKVKLHDHARKIVDQLFREEIDFDQAEKLLRNEVYLFTAIMHERSEIEAGLWEHIGDDVNDGFGYAVRYNANVIFTKRLSNNMAKEQLRRAIQEEGERLKSLSDRREEIMNHLSAGLIRLSEAADAPKDKRDPALVAMVRHALSEEYWKDLYQAYPFPEKIGEIEDHFIEKLYEVYFNSVQNKNTRRHSAGASVRLAFQTALREITPTEMSQNPVDVLYVGLEDSHWMAKQTILDIQQLFRDANAYNLKDASVNELLLTLREQANRSDFQIRLPSGDIITNQTLVVAFSQSGVTFPAWHSVNGLIKKREEDEHRLELVREMAKSGTDRIFAVTGELDTPLGRAVGQKFTDDAEFCGHIFVTHVERQESEARSQSAMMMHALGTEIIIGIADLIRRFYPGSDPFGMRLEQADIRALKAMRDRLIDEGLPQITGVGADGGKIKNQTAHDQLVGLGKQLGWDILDGWWGRLVLWGYVLATVAFGMTPLGMGLFQAVSPSTVPWAIHAAHGFDALFYILISPLWIYFFRFITGRMVMARLSGRTIYFADIDAVANPLFMFLTKVMALSFGFATINVDSGDPRADFVTVHGHRIGRGDIALFLLPDGRLGALSAARDATIQSERHLVNGKNMGGKPKLWAVGPRPVDKEEIGLFDEYVQTIPDDSSISDDTPRKRKGKLEQLQDTRIDALKRMAAGFVIVHAMAERVSFGGRLFKYWRTKSGAGAPTTAIPVAAQSILWWPFIHIGMISRQTALRWAFLEGLVFFGLIVSLPLNLMAPASADTWRMPLVVLSGIIFGFLGHPRLTAWKAGKPVDGGRAGFGARLQLMFTGMAFQLPLVLQQGAHIGKGLFLTLLLHAIYDWTLSAVQARRSSQDIPAQSVPEGSSAPVQPPPELDPKTLSRNTGRRTVVFSLSPPPAPPAEETAQVEPAPKPEQADPFASWSRPTRRKKVEFTLPPRPSDFAPAVAPAPSTPQPAKSSAGIPRWAKVVLWSTAVVIGVAIVLMAFNQVPLPDLHKIITSGSVPFHQVKDTIFGAKTGQGTKSSGGSSSAGLWASLLAIGAVLALVGAHLLFSKRPRATPPTTARRQPRLRWVISLALAGLGIGTWLFITDDKVVAPAKISSGSPSAPRATRVNLSVLPQLQTLIRAKDLQALIKLKLPRRDDSEMAVTALGQQQSIALELQDVVERIDQFSQSKISEADLAASLQRASDGFRKLLQDRKISRTYGLLSRKIPGQKGVFLNESTLIELLNLLEKALTPGQRPSNPGAALLMPWGISFLTAPRLRRRAHAHLEILQWGA